MPTGKAFEYACLISLQELLDGHDIEIVQNQAYITALNAYNEEEDNSRTEMRQAANAGFRVILRHEPQLTNAMGNVPLILSIQSDAAGIAGDVRDLLCIRQQNGWVIGISCKHNHSALKHSRLSQTIDFGLQWFATGCSQEYFNDISPIFENLRRLQEDNYTWRRVPEKINQVYRPLLIAFINEMQRLYNQHGAIIPTRLISYLVGRRDFYKLIDRSRERITRVQAFNMYGTLNRNAGNIRAINVPNIPLPTRIFNIGFLPESNNTIEINCDNGWTVSFRIHNATTFVEPSLKFDINLSGNPHNLFSHDEPWA